MTTVGYVISSSRLILSSGSIIELFIFRETINSKNLFFVIIEIRFFYDSDHVFFLGRHHTEESERGRFRNVFDDLGLFPVRLLIQSDRLDCRG